MPSPSRWPTRISTGSTSREFSGGGGGAGMGRGIFVMEGTSLTVSGTFAVNGGIVSGGPAGGGGATAREAFGTGLFLQGSDTIASQSGAGQTQTLTDDIADEAPSVAGGYTPPAGFGTPSRWSLTKTGAGPLILSDPNPYSGGTTMNGGTLSVGVRVAFASLKTQMEARTAHASSNFQNAAVSSAARSLMVVFAPL